MKRFIAHILTLVLILSCISISVFAAGRSCSGAGLRRNCVYEQDRTACVSLCRSRGAFCRQGIRYIDENHDGICDNRDLNCTVGGGRGICGSRGANYTDGNNDGICDSKPAESCTPKGTGQHHGGQHHGGRKGCHQ